MSKDRVLIVDDEKNIVSSLHGILQDEGYEIATADDGLDALERVQSDPPDLVLLDIWIPGMDGIEVLKTIKTYHPEIEVLIMSGHGTIDTAVKATKLGAFDFIEKPFSLDQLVQSVDKALKLKKARPQGTNGNGAGKTDLPECFQMMVEVKKGIKNAAKHNKPVLLTGELGTGKEFVAQAIHKASKKSNLPFLKVNCAVRPMTAVQSVLLAPTKKNAEDKSQDKTKPARNRVVYLKNIDALSEGLQGKLAQALKARAASKKNGSGPELLPARIYGSTTRDLDQLITEGKFDADLGAHLKETVLHVPPLRDFQAELPELINRYFDELSETTQLPRHTLTDEALEALTAHTWQENLKELREVLDYLARAVHPEEPITVEHLPPQIARSDSRIEMNSAKEGETVRWQRTLKRSVVLCGQGLHSGIKTGLIMQPMPPNSGIIFGDISSDATLQARLENVESTDYSTCLKKGFFSVATIEHIMAVLHMYRVTNLLIKIGDEAPVMDGSAKDFCQLVEDGEFEDQKEPVEELVIDKPYLFGDPKGAHIRIEPADRLEVSYHMEYPEPIGVMDYTYKFEGDQGFKKDIAPARTFGFMEDVAQLTKMGFATGGKLDNFILLGDKKVLNTELRYPDEFARHKILDILGDFYLLGKPLRGRIHAHKSGHTQNIGLLKEIQTSLS